MESGSRIDNPPERTSLKLADLFGTIIALLTLVMPLMAIANFSTTQSGVLSAPPVMRK